MTTAARAAGLASDWLREAEWAGPSAAAALIGAGRGRGGAAEAVAAGEAGARPRRYGRAVGVATPKPALPDLFHFFQVTRHLLRL